MLNLNSLFQHDISPWWAGAGRIHRHGQHGAGTASSQSATTVAGDNVQQAITQAYQSLHASVQGQLQPVNASSDVAPPQADAQDLSPQAVADRVVGFISDRLNQAQANGATQDQLQTLYNQALKGVERGLTSARNILQAQGVYSGDTRTNFSQTVNLIADGLQSLGQTLFAPNSTTSVSDTGTAGATNANLTQLAASSTRSFQLQVVTQEGDKVTIDVNAAQVLAVQQGGYSTGTGNVSAFNGTLASSNHFSFSVQGNLNANELKSLNDLFQQVNRIADTFYGGDVQQAFDQASQVGVDSQQIAGFAVNIQQTQTVAVRNTYASVQNAGAQQASASSDQTPYQSLGDFAGQLQQAGGDVSAQDSGVANAKSLLAQLVALLYAGNGNQQDNSQSFQQFTHHVLG